MKKRKAFFNVTDVATHVATPPIFSVKRRHSANKTRGIERGENSSEQPKTALAVSRMRYHY